MRRIDLSGLRSYLTHKIVVFKEFINGLPDRSFDLETWIITFMVITVILFIFSKITIAAISAMFTIIFLFIFDYNKGDDVHYHRENLKKRLENERGEQAQESDNRE